MSNNLTNTNAVWWHKRERNSNGIFERLIHINPFETRHCFGNAKKVEGFKTWALVGNLSYLNGDISGIEGEALLVKATGIIDSGTLDTIRKFKRNCIFSIYVEYKVMLLEIKERQGNKVTVTKIDVARLMEKTSEEILNIINTSPKMYFSLTSRN